MASKSTIIPYEIGERVKLRSAFQAHPRDANAPLTRPLRIYTFDPSVSDRLGGIATVRVPYEKLAPGPVGSLFEVRCDGVPAPLKANALDLDDPYLLLSDGLTPTPANGQFHLQMVYAVCSLTYAVFRRALGRDVVWSFPTAPDGSHRLVVKPFGFEGRNAGFNRETRDLAFGYFAAGAKPAGFTVPNGLICTALSHDIIAHETTHALLDGLRASFTQPSNVDVLAFHEGFADLVALFLHFTYPEVVEQQIRESQEPFGRGSLLTDVAREFGYSGSSSERGTALRSGVDVDGIAAFDSDVPPSGDKGPKCYDESLEPHELGSVLVSAVFEAFITIVRRKTDRYLRIAGLGPNSPGSVMSDALVKAIAREAGDVAGQFLDLCIRAVDYCPPTGMRLGEYLRAMITADGDLVVRDNWSFREALMRSFRRRRIFPANVKFMTEDAVRWSAPSKPVVAPGLAFKNLRFAGDPGTPADAQESRRQAKALGDLVTAPAHARLFGLIAPQQPLPKGVTYVAPATIESVRVARRVAPDGRIVFDVIGEVTQTCTIQRNGDTFETNGGCTVVIDADGQVRYTIYKRADQPERQARQHAAIRGALKAYWRKSKGRLVPVPQVLRRLHDGENAETKR